MTKLSYENGISILDTLNVSLTGFIVVMIILGILAVLVVLLSKAIRGAEKAKKSHETSEENPVETAELKPTTVAPSITPIIGNALPENQSEGSLDLYRTDEKSAAAIMAIISNTSGISLNRLKFNSIKLIEENQRGY
ncbi:MAG: OadG family transporter subunit [Oscillospiraceae bacterium]